MKTRSSLLLATLVAALSVLLLSAMPAVAVREGDFKKCADSSFCRRIRRLSSLDPAPPSPYSIAIPSFNAASSVLTTPVTSALYPDVQFELQIRFHKDGTARLKMDQVGQTLGGFKRYAEAEQYAIDSQPVPAEEGSVTVKQTEDETRVT